MEAFLTIADAAKLIAAKQLSPVELTRICLDRISNLDPTLHSFLLVTEDRAMADAKAAEASDDVGKDKGTARRHPYWTQGHLQHRRYPNHRPFEVVGA